MKNIILKTSSLSSSRSFFLNCRRIGMARKRIGFLRTHLVKKKGVISSLLNKSNLAVPEDTLRNNNNGREVTQTGAQLFFFGGVFNNLLIRWRVYHGIPKYKNLFERCVRPYSNVSTMTEPNEGTGTHKGNFLGCWMMWKPLERLYRILILLIWHRKWNINYYPL